MDRLGAKTPVKLPPVVSMASTATKSTASDPPKGLDVIVVGAGIAGLTAAISLRQSGHNVKIFEKSHFVGEVGAAFGLSPNGVKVLKALGFSFECARARPVKVWDVVDAVSLKTLDSMELGSAEKVFGAEAYTVHRVDMHNELLRMAEERDQEKPGVQVHLSSRAVGGNAMEGYIELEDGSRHCADLIIAADGVHSVLRSLVVGAEAESRSTGFSAFRFLIPTQKLLDDPNLSGLLYWKSRGATVLTDVRDEVPERHMVWYDCRGGEVQNFVGIHPTITIPLADDGTPDYKAGELEQFQAYHDDIKHIISIADDVSCWPLDNHAPLSHWAKGKMLLIGDAAHPMLPFGGQGANQAIEDAGALGRVLQNVQSGEDTAARLDLFESIRVKRASFIQTLSKVRAGREKEVEQELREFVEPGSRTPESLMERNVHAYSHDVIAASDEALAMTGLL